MISKQQLTLLGLCLIVQSNRLALEYWFLYIAFCLSTSCIKACLAYIANSSYFLSLVRQWDHSFKDSSGTHTFSLTAKVCINYITSVLGKVTVYVDILYILGMQTMWRYINIICSKCMWMLPLCSQWFCRLCHSCLTIIIRNTDEQVTFNNLILKLIYLPSTGSEWPVWHVNFPALDTISCIQKQGNYCLTKLTQPLQDDRFLWL